MKELEKWHHSNKYTTNYIVCNLFDVVIWVTVSDFTNLELHECIVETIKLDNISTSSDPDHTRKHFYAYLKEKIPSKYNHHQPKKH